MPDACVSMMVLPAQLEKKDTGDGMRVIAGEFRGRPLSAVPGKNTRPTTDKVKEAIFNMIGPYFDGGWVLDLFAGTGSLGIEALSRGAERAVFIDLNNRAVQVIKENIARLQLEPRTEVYRNEAARALKTLAKREVRFDLVFLDPPYAEQNIAVDLEAMQAYGLLNPGAWIVCETDASVTLPDRVGECQKNREAVYGDTRITLYSHMQDQEEDV